VRTINKKADEFEEIRKALLKRAVGYEYEETEITASKDGKVTKITKNKRYSPSDLRAAMFLYSIVEKGK
jgi:hypothetical protein